MHVLKQTNPLLTGGNVSNKLFCFTHLSFYLYNLMCVIDVLQIL